MVHPPTMAILGVILAIIIGVSLVGKSPIEVTHEVTQEADLKALITRYNELANTLPKAKTPAERTQIIQEGFIVISRIRTLVDTLPEDKVPVEAKRFKLVR